MSPRSLAFVASAPGKVILHGEHSVVYGKLALAMSIGLRTMVKVELAETLDDKSTLRVEFPDLKREYCFSMDELIVVKNKHLGDPVCTRSLNLNLVNSLKSFLDSDGGEDLGLVALLYLFVTSHHLKSLVENDVTVTVTSEVPIGAGLGSSAAFSVALAGALFKASFCASTHGVSSNGVGFPHHGEKIVAKKARRNSGEDTNMEDFTPDEKDVVCKRAFLAEKILHGNPSGIDNSVCTFGGLLSYRSSEGMTPLLAPGNLRVMLVNTRVSRNTKAMVEAVRVRALALPKVIAGVLDAMDLVSRRCMDTLSRLRKVEATKGRKREERELYKTLEELIDTNQGLLAALGVSHPALDRVHAIAAHHRLHAKLTGAGGGGFALTLLPPRDGATTTINGAGDGASNVTEARREMEKNGFDCWETQVGGPGVQWKRLEL